MQTQVFVDVTPEVQRRIAAGDRGGRWCGHVWDNADSLTSDTAGRPQDLRVSKLPVPASTSTEGSYAGARLNPPLCATLCFEMGMQLRGSNTI